MNVLFLVHRYPKKGSILEKDIIKTFAKNGNDVLVIVPNDKKNKEETYIYEEEHIKILYVKTGNYSNDVSKIEKGITLLTRDFFLKRGVKKYLLEKKIDYVFGYTPFMANPSLIKWIKRRYNAKSFLFLWDIFPQNAKDLGIIKNKLIFKFLRYKEKKMYDNFDKIICNCEGQIEYILKNELKKKKELILIRNSEILEKSNVKIDKDILKLKYGYKKDDIIGIFGGNMGIPQKLDNLFLMAEKLKKYNNLKFIFIGQGTEKNKLKNLVENKNLKNTKIMDFVERIKYEEILKMSDIALISLNENYTVPNFPAKVTGYCKLGKPIFASLDSCSYKFLGQFIKINKIGEISLAKDIEDTARSYIKLTENLDDYNPFEINKVYQEQFNVEKAYKNLIIEMNKI